MSGLKGLLYLLGIGSAVTAVSSSNPLWLLVSFVSFGLVFNLLK